MEPLLLCYSRTVVLGGEEPPAPDGHGLPLLRRSGGCPPGLPQRVLQDLRPDLLRSQVNGEIFHNCSKDKLNNWINWSIPISAFRPNPLIPKRVTIVLNAYEQLCLWSSDGSRKWINVEPCWKILEVTFASIDKFLIGCLTSVLVGQILCTLKKWLWYNRFSSTQCWPSSCRTTAWPPSRTSFSSSTPAPSTSTAWTNW